MRPLNWGILGTGHIAEILAHAVTMAGAANLYGVASRTPERAAQSARAFGCGRSYGSYQALLDDPDIDVVYIALPNGLHHAWTLAAARAGKHILTEKPLGMNEQEVDDMFETAEEQGVILMEAFKYPFHPQWQPFMETLRSGQLGPLRAIQGTFCFPMRDLSNVRLRKELAGGAMWDLGCYPISFFTLILDQEPISMTAQALIGADSGVDEVFTGCLQYPEDVCAVFECNFRTQYRQRGEVAGEHGTIEFPEPFHPSREAPTAWYLTSEEDDPETRSFDTCNAFTGEVEHFCGCVREQKEPYFNRRHSTITVRTIERLFGKALREPPI